MIKEKIRGMVDKADQKIEENLKKSESVKNSSMYSNEHKLQVQKDLKQECLDIKRNLSTEVATIFDKKIDEAKKVNIYEDNKPDETANIIKMIEMSKENMSKRELEYFLEIYKDNNIIKRILRAVADEKGMNIDMTVIPVVSELEDLKDALTGAIRNNSTFYVNSISTQMAIDLIDF